MISKIYNSDQILHKAWSRKGKPWYEIALKEERMKDFKARDKKRIKYLEYLIEKNKKKKKKKKKKPQGKAAKLDRLKKHVNSSGALKGAKNSMAKAKRKRNGI